MTALLAEVTLASTKGVEYLIAILGLVAFLILLRFLKPPGRGHPPD